MKLTNSIKTSIATALTLAVMASPVMAGERGHDGEGKPAHCMKHKKHKHSGQDFPSVKHMKRKLDLTDEQADKIEAILAAAKAERKEQSGSLHSMKKELTQLTHSEDYDESAVKALFAQYQADMQDKMLAKSKVHHEIWLVLTPAQREKLSERMSKRHDRS